MANAPADGYTLLLGSSTTQVFNFVTSAKFPYNPSTDFTPIARVVDDRVVLLVGERLPVKNMGEFLELCKKPGVNISYGNISENGFSGFSGEILNHACGGALKEVAFDRCVPALAALGNGRIDALFTTLRTAISLSEKYSAKLIGVADEHPLAGYDEKISIPKYITGFSLTSWQGLFGPANLPEAITKILNEKVASFKLPVQSEKMRLTFQVGGTPRDLAAIVIRDIKIAGELVQIYGIKKQ